jgi:hypothetical protein
VRQGAEGIHGAAWRGGRQRERRIEPWRVYHHQLKWSTGNKKLLACVQLARVSMSAGLYEACTHKRDRLVRREWIVVWFVGMSHARRYGCACVLASTTTTVKGWRGSARSGSRVRSEVGGGMREYEASSHTRAHQNPLRERSSAPPPLILSSCSLSLEEGSDTAAHLGCGRLRVGGGKLH